MPVDHDRGTCFGEPPRNRRADVLSRPGDNSDASVEIGFMNARHQRAPLWASGSSPQADKNLVRIGLIDLDRLMAIVIRKSRRTRAARSRRECLALARPNSRAS